MLKDSITAQMQLQEQLLEYLLKIEAQIEILLMIDLYACAADQLYSYLCVVNDLVSNARSLNEQILNKLLRAI